MKRKKIPETYPALTIPTSKNSFVAVSVEPINGKYLKSYVGERHTFNLKAVLENLDPDIPILVVEDEVHCMRIIQNSCFSAQCIAFGDTIGMGVMIEELNNFFKDIENKPKFLIINDDYESPISEHKTKKLLKRFRDAGYNVAVL